MPKRNKSAAPTLGTRRSARLASKEASVEPRLASNAGSVEPLLEVIESSGHAASDHGASDHGASDHAASDHAASDHAASDHAASDHAASDHAASDHAASDHAASDHAASDHAASDHAASDHAASDHAASDHAASDPDGSDPDGSDDGDGHHSVLHPIRQQDLAGLAWRILRGERELINSLTASQMKVVMGEMVTFHKECHDRNEDETDTLRQILDEATRERDALKKSNALRFKFAMQHFTEQQEQVVMSPERCLASGHPLTAFQQHAEENEQWATGPPEPEPDDEPVQELVNTGGELVQTPGQTPIGQDATWSFKRLLNYVSEPLFGKRGTETRPDITSEPNVKRMRFNSHSEEQIIPPQHNAGSFRPTTALSQHRKNTRGDVRSRGSASTRSLLTVRRLDGSTDPASSARLPNRTSKGAIEPEDVISGHQNVAQARRRVFEHGGSTPATEPTRRPHQRFFGHGDPSEDTPENPLEHRGTARPLEPTRNLQQGFDTYHSSTLADEHTLTRNLQPEAPALAQAPTDRPQQPVSGYNKSNPSAQQISGHPPKLVSHGMGSRPNGRQPDNTPRDYCGPSAKNPNLPTSLSTINEFTEHSILSTMSDTPSKPGRAAPPTPPSQTFQRPPKRRYESGFENAPQPAAPGNTPYSAALSSAPSNVRASMAQSTPTRPRTIAKVRAARHARELASKMWAWERTAPRPRAKHPDADARLAKILRMRDLEKELERLKHDADLQGLEAPRVKRVKVDNLAAIPHNRPGESTGTFCAPDIDSDDEMEVDEKVEERSNVFQEREGESVRAIQSQQPSAPACLERTAVEHTFPTVDIGESTHRKPPTEADRNPPTEADRNPPTETDRNPPTEADRNPPTEADRNPPTEADRNPPTEADRNPPTEADRNPPTEADRNPPTETDRNPPTETDRNPPTEAATLFVKSFGGGSAETTNHTGQETPKDAATTSFEMPPVFKFPHVASKPGDYHTTPDYREACRKVFASGLAAWISTGGY